MAFIPDDPALLKLARKLSSEFCRIDIFRIHRDIFDATWKRETIKAYEKYRREMKQKIEPQVIVEYATFLIISGEAEMAVEILCEYDEEGSIVDSGRPLLLLKKAEVFQQLLLFEDSLHCLQDIGTEIPKPFNSSNIDALMGRVHGQNLEVEASEIAWKKSLGDKWKDLKGLAQTWIKYASQFHNQKFYGIGADFFAQALSSRSSGEVFPIALYRRMAECFLYSNKHVEASSVLKDALQHYHFDMSIRTMYANLNPEEYRKFYLIEDKSVRVILLSYRAYKKRIARFNAIRIQKSFRGLIGRRSAILRRSASLEIQQKLRQILQNRHERKSRYSRPETCPNLEMRSIPSSSETPQKSKPPRSSPQKTKKRDHGPKRKKPLHVEGKACKAYLESPSDYLQEVHKFESKLSEEVASTMEGEQITTTSVAHCLQSKESDAVREQEKRDEMDEAYSEYLQKILQKSNSSASAAMKRKKAALDFERAKPEWMNELDSIVEWINETSFNNPKKKASKNKRETNNAGSELKDVSNSSSISSYIGIPWRTIVLHRLESVESSYLELNTDYEMKNFCVKLRQLKSRVNALSVHEMRLSVEDLIAVGVDDECGRNSEFRRLNNKRNECEEAHSRHQKYTFNKPGPKYQYYKNKITPKLVQKKKERKTVSNLLINKTRSVCASYQEELQKLSGIPLTKDNNSSLKTQYHQLLIRTSKSGAVRECFQTFQRIEKIKGFEPDLFCYQLLLQACKNSDPCEPKLAVEVFAKMKRKGVPVSSSVLNLLLGVYAKGGYWRKAISCFRELTTSPYFVVPNTFIYETLSRACSTASIDDAPTVYETMKFAGVPEFLAYSTANSILHRKSTSTVHQ